MQRSIDFALPGGWHVTVFHPWGCLLLAAVVLLLIAFVFKFAMTR